MSNPFKGIYFTKNDVWRSIGLILVIIGQFTNRHSYQISDYTFETSELSLIGVAIAIIFPLLMRKLGDENAN